MFAVVSMIMGGAIWLLDILTSAYPKVEVSENVMTTTIIGSIGIVGADML